MVSETGCYTYIISFTQPFKSDDEKDDFPSDEESSAGFWSLGDVAHNNSRDDVMAETTRGDDVTADTTRGDDVTADTTRGDDVTADTTRGDDVTADTTRDDDVTDESSGDDDVIIDTSPGELTSTSSSPLLPSTPSLDVGSSGLGKNECIFECFPTFLLFGDVLYSGSRLSGTRL